MKAPVADLGETCSLCRKTAKGMIKIGTNAKMVKATPAVRCCRLNSTRGTPREGPIHAPIGL